MDTSKISRLAHIMDLFGVKGMDLAQHLHVDNSLVSKWRSGKRKLYPNSTILNKITDFFMVLDSSSGHKTIKNILKNVFLEADLSSTETIKLLFSRWLSEYPDGDLLNPSISSLDKNKYTTQFTVYKNLSGRRQAARNFMDLVLSLPGDQELFFLDFGDLSWRHKDDLFFELWKKNFEEIVAKGNQITILNFIDRDVHSLIEILITWLPMDITGNVSSYYHSKFTDALFQPSLAILKNKAAHVGMSAEGFTKQPYVQFFTDLPTVQHCQALFEAALSTCRPLYEKCYYEERHKFSEALIDMEKFGGDNYISMGMPFFNTLPEELLIMILTENSFNSKEMKDCLLFYRQYNKQFYKNVEKFTYRYFYNLELIQSALASDEIVYNEFMMLTGKQVKLTKEHFYQHLKHIINLSEKYPNFQIALPSENIENNFIGINIWTKENIITIANRVVLKNDKPFALYTKETTINNAYYRYFTELWNSVPRLDRDKAHIKTKIHQLLSS